MVIDSRVLTSWPGRAIKTQPLQPNMGNGGWSRRARFLYIYKLHEYRTGTQQILRHDTVPDPYLKQYFHRNGHEKIHLNCESFWFPLLLFRCELSRASDRHHQFTALELDTEKRSIVRGPPKAKIYFFTYHQSKLCLSYEIGVGPNTNPQALLLTHLCL